MSTTTVAATRAEPSHNGTVFFYFGSLTLLVYIVLPHGYLIDIATSFILKDQLHASAERVSWFRLLTGLPVYLSFLFGLARDLWNPFGLKDRGFFFLFAPLSAAVFIWMAYSPLSYAGLFAGMLLVMCTFRFVAAAYQGLLALVGQEQLMSGRLSALWNIMQSVPYVLGAMASGYLAEHFSARQIFLLVAALTAALGFFAIWKPSAVFGRAYNQPLARGTTFVGDLRRLVRHRAIYAPILMLFLFQFSPGSNTPLQFYLTNELHASDAAYGYWYAIFLGSFIPVFLLYGWLCQRVSLEKLLWWGTIITVPQMIPLLFVHSVTTALVLAVPIGCMGGIAAGAYYDLAMRSCPPGLQGTLMMLVDGFYQLSYRGGDLLGSWIYGSSPTHGFLYCVLAITAVYALILPTILLVPKEVMSSSDGERNAQLEADVLAEVGASSR
ncbi:MAG TPA: MFS transporter [Steroidobacteraceae bacterium]|nr:MFS transporter [Steroidobacteraceae bacterium]